MLDPDFVIAVHDEIIREIGGLAGLGPGGEAGVRSALARVENYAAYDDLNDVFGVAALYAVAIARGHVFNDGNKRTGLTCALAYLAQQDITISKSPVLEDLMVDVAGGVMDREDFAYVLSALWQESNPEAPAAK